MNYRRFFADEDAVSPVIGVILMVAITVILAAVIGTFVLGLGDQVQQTAPTSNFQVDEGSLDYEAGTDDSPTTHTTVTLSHSGGQSVPKDQVSVTVNGNPAYGVDSESDAEADDTSVQANTLWGGSGDLSAGSSATVVLYDTDTAENDWEPSSDSHNPLDEDFAGNTGASGLSSDETVRIIWTSQDGSQSSTLKEYTLG